MASLLGILPSIPALSPLLDPVLGAIDPVTGELPLVNDLNLDGLLGGLTGGDGILGGLLGGEDPVGDLLALDGLLGGLLGEDNALGGLLGGTDLLAGLVNIDGILGEGSLLSSLPELEGLLDIEGLLGGIFANGLLPATGATVDSILKGLLSTDALAGPLTTSVNDVLLGLLDGVVGATGLGGTLSALPIVPGVVDIVNDLLAGTGTIDDGDTSGGGLPGGGEPLPTPALGGWRDELVSAEGFPTPDRAAVLAQLLYVGYYNRAADPDGQKFWVNKLITDTDISKASREFANLPEAQELYPVLKDPAAATDADILAFVDGVFQNVFGRSVDEAGAAFYLQLFKDLRDGPLQGEVGTIVTRILDGAINADVLLLAQKVEIANIYTDSLIVAEKDYNLAFGQDGIFAGLEAGKSDFNTTQAIAAAVGLGRAPFVLGTTDSDEITSANGTDIINLGKDTAADKLIFKDKDARSDIIQFFGAEDTIGLTSAGFAGAPAAGTTVIKATVAEAATSNLAQTILFDSAANLATANLSNVRFAVNTTTGRLIFDGDGNFGTTNDQATLAAFDGFDTAIFDSSSFSFI